jgi:hypothetical protein
VASLGSVVRLWLAVALFVPAFSALGAELTAVRLESADGHVRANIELSDKAALPGVHAG